jgi:hypothetical protein
MNPDRQWLNLDWNYNELVKVFRDRGFYEPSRERVLKTLLADGASPYHRITAEKPSSLSDEYIKALLHAYDMWPLLTAGDDTISDRKEVENNLATLQQLSLICQRKRLAVCEGGYLALIPRFCGFLLEHLRIDTGYEFKVGILHGSRSPIILLEVDDKGFEDLSAYSRWMVYGQCYVEGHMYGEVVDWDEGDAEILELW